LRGFEIGHAKDKMIRRKATKCQLVLEEFRQVLINHVNNYEHDWFVETSMRLCLEGNTLTSHLSSGVQSLTAMLAMK